MDNVKTGYAKITEQRMKPGAEVGGVKRMRFPDADVKLPTELSDWYTKAEARSKILGHNPEIWRCQRNAIEVRCKKCGESGGVAVFPPPGKSNINGEIFDRTCREK